MRRICDHALVAPAGHSRSLHQQRAAYITPGCEKAGIEKLATVVLHATAPAASRLRGRGVNYKMRGSRASTRASRQSIEIEKAREHEEELDDELDADGSEVDAEGEVDEDDDSGSEIVGPVKRQIRSRRRKVEDEEASEESASGAEDDESNASSESSSNAEVDWEAENEGDEEAEEAEMTGSNRCV